MILFKLYLRLCGLIICFLIYLTRRDINIQEKKKALEHRGRLFYYKYTHRQHSIWLKSLLYLWILKTNVLFFYSRNVNRFLNKCLHAFVFFLHMFQFFILVNAFRIMRFVWELWEKKIEELIIFALFLLIIEFHSIRLNFYM